MINRLGKILLLSSFFFSAVASASSISLLRTDSLGSVNVDDTIMFDLILDATGADTNGNTLNTTIASFYSGSIGIGYDTGALLFEGLTSSTATITDLLSDTNNEKVTFNFADLGSAVQGIENGVIGSIQFTATSPGSTGISLFDVNSIGSLLQEASGGITSFSPELMPTSFDVSTAPIPLPATLWLMFSGLGLLFGSTKLRH